MPSPFASAGRRRISDHRLHPARLRGRVRVASADDRLPRRRRGRAWRSPSALWLRDGARLRPSQTTRPTTSARAAGIGAIGGCGRIVAGDDDVVPRAMQPLDHQRAVDPQHEHAGPRPHAPVGGIDQDVVAVGDRRHHRIAPRDDHAAASRDPARAGAASSPASARPRRPGRPRPARPGPPRPRRRAAAPDTASRRPAQRRFAQPQIVGEHPPVAFGQHARRTAPDELLKIGVVAARAGATGGSATHPPAPPPSSRFSRTCIHSERLA